MEGLYSTLELVEHDGRSTLELLRQDETARAPERDNNTELTSSCLAPEAKSILFIKLISDHRNGFYQTQYRSCSTTTLYLKSITTLRYPQSNVPIGMLPSL